MTHFYEKTLFTLLDEFLFRDIRLRGSVLYEVDDFDV